MKTKFTKESTHDLLEALEFISNGLHRAANGGFTCAGEKMTVGKLKTLIRNYRTVAETAISRASGQEVTP